MKNWKMIFRILFEHLNLRLADKRGEASLPDFGKFYRDENGVLYFENSNKIIRYTYTEVDDEEEYKECFVGFEYKGTEDSGLFGLKIGSFEEELSDSYIKGLFNQVFASEK